MLRARTIRLPGSVLTASRKPQHHSACAASRPDRAGRSLPGPVQPSGPRTRDGADRQRGRTGLLAVVFGQACCQDRPELLEGAPQPAGPAVGLALVRQHREQAAPVAGHLGHEPGLAAPAGQVPDHGDGQQLSVSAGRARFRPGRDRDDPGNHQVIDDHADVDEQVLG